MENYFTALLQFLEIFPTLVLCYLPMKNQLKFKPEPRRVCCTSATIFIFCVVAAGLKTALGVNKNIIFLPLLALLFFYYQVTVKVDVTRALAIFVDACVWLSFPIQISYYFDAILHPTSGMANISIEAATLQFFVSCLFVIILAYPCLHWYAWNVDHVDLPKIWSIEALLYGVFYVVHFLMTPYLYQTLYTGRVFPLMIVLESIIFLVFLLLHVIFYRIAFLLLERVKMSKQLYVLEMEAHQYRSLQNYIKQTSRLRHDFRHSVHLLNVLAEKDDLPSLKAHLWEYEKRLEMTSPVTYCGNVALNALFNYYREMAETVGVKIDWHIQIPEPLTISELDLSGLFGNLLENALDGCQTLPEGERYFSLTTEVRQCNCLYIVSTNSFNGQVKKFSGGYVSTKHTGQGMGLFSITSICEKYNGYARVTSQENEFLMDLMLEI